MYQTFYTQTLKLLYKTFDFIYFNALFGSNVKRESY